MRELWSATSPAATRGGPWERGASGLWLPVWWPRELGRGAGPASARGQSALGGASPARLLDVERIVDTIAWSPRNPLVRRAIEERARADGCSVAEVRRRELQAALYLALAERGRPQTHRFGRSWLTDESGRAAETIPEQLPPELFERWLADEARKAAEASLLGHAYPGGRPLQLERVGSLEELPGGGPDPLFVLLAREEREEADRRWREVVAAATPRQRDLLGAMVEQVTGGSAPSPSAAAAHLGIAESTARVQWKRLVDRQRRA
jgi:hypothetical protein